MNRLLFLVAILFAASCATPYQDLGLLGGLTEKQLDKGVFQLSLLGNGFTSYGRAESMILLKASELTLANGYDRFVLLPHESIWSAPPDAAELRSIALTGSRGGREGLASVKMTKSSVYSQGISLPTQRIDGSVIVVMFGPSDTNAPKGIDARSTAEQLRPLLLPDQTSQKPKQS
jgi:hypothetical protein